MAFANYYHSPSILSRRSTSLTSGALTLLFVVTFVHASTAQSVVAHYDPESGNVTLDARSLTHGIQGYQLESGLLRSERHVPIMRTVHTLTDSSRISEMMIGGSIPAGVYDLGSILPRGLDSLDGFFDPSTSTVYSSSRPVTLNWRVGATSLAITNDPAIEPLHYDRWATAATLLYTPQDGNLKLDTTGHFGGAIAGFSVESSQNQLLGAAFDPIIGEGMVEGSSSVLFEFTSQGIEEGVHDLGNVLPSQLGLADVARIVSTSRLFMPLGQGSSEFDSLSLLSPLSSASSFEMSFALFHGQIFTWSNPTDPLDTTGDGFVTAQDALVIVNDINANQGRELPTLTANPEFFLDVNGDGFIAPSDVLKIVIALNDSTALAPRAISVPEPTCNVAWLGVVAIVCSLQCRKPKRQQRQQRQQQWATQQ